MIPCRQNGNSGLVEAARYAAQGETGCLFTLARCGGIDRLADGPLHHFESQIKTLTILFDLRMFIKD